MQMVIEHEYPASQWEIDGRRVVDFALDAYGRLELSIRASRPCKIHVAIGEVLTATRRLNATPGGYRYYAETELDVIAGEMRVFFPIPEHVAPNPALRKCYPPPEAGGEIAPFRYVEYDVFDGELSPIRHNIHAPFDDNAADFHCDNERLNRIWALCKHTIKATTPFGLYIDGNRERLPYEGDAYINALGHYCCDADYRIAHDTISRLLETPTWPTEWSLVMPMIVLDYLKYSGDKKSVQEWLDAGLEKKLLLDDLDPVTGLLRSVPYGNRTRDIVDWPISERDGYEFGTANFVPNAYLVWAFRAMAMLTQDGHWSNRANELLHQMEKRFWRNNGLFGDSLESSHTSLHTAMFALCFDIARPEARPAFCKFMESRGMACSVYGAQFLLDACYENGMEEHAFRLMTATGLRSWQNMLDKGATITMEAWDDSCKPNQDWNHAWGAAPANIIPRRLCGIRPFETDRFYFDPHPQGLRSFHLKAPSRFGSFLVDFDGKGYDIQIPEGTEVAYLGPRPSEKSIFLPPGTHHIPLLKENQA